MALQLKFNEDGNVEMPTLIVSKRSGKKIGIITNFSNFQLKDTFNGCPEMSFEVYKYDNGVKTPFWDDIKNFRLIWCVEWDMWFEITYSLTENTGTIKDVNCKRLGECELSQIMLHNIEINTEDDLEANNKATYTDSLGTEHLYNPNYEKYYLATTLYDSEHPHFSLLNRILKDKAGHYTIKHVDDSLKNVQRKFDFSDKSIKDCIDDIADEIGIHVEYNSGSSQYGYPERGLSFYDLYTVCLNDDCDYYKEHGKKIRYRGEFNDKCPICGSTNLQLPYGKNTNILVDAQGLTDEIELTTDTGSVKNIFYLKSNDDLMDATIRNCNPSGSSYLYIITPEMKNEMSDDLLKILDDNTNEVEKYSKTNCIELPLINGYEDIYKSYNNIVNLYKDNYSLLHDGYKWGAISDSQIAGGGMKYAELTKLYYDAVDLYYYIKTSMMPSDTLNDINGEYLKSQYDELKTDLNNDDNELVVMYLSNNTVSETQARSAISNYAKYIIDSRISFAIETLSISNTSATFTFSLTSKTDNNMTYNAPVSTSVNFVDISGQNEMNTKKYISQKIKNVLNHNVNYFSSLKSMVAMKSDFTFALDLDGFKAELKKYSLDCLVEIKDCITSCMNIIQEQISNGTWAEPTESGNALSDKLWKPYVDRAKIVEQQIVVMDERIAVINGNDNKNGIIQITESLKKTVNDKCNLDKKLNDAISYATTEEERIKALNLRNEFNSFRRENTWQNTNYSSEGLSNAELYLKAKEFLQKAEDEIYKSATLQHQINSNLHNLLVIPEFRPLVNSFEVGNFINVKVEDDIYKLRLLEYTLDFDNLQDLDITFSDVKKIVTGYSDTASVLSQASQMSSSYAGTKQQAELGKKTYDDVTGIKNDGLKTDSVVIDGSNDSQHVKWDTNGLLFYSMDTDTGEISDEQFRISNNLIVFTNNNWETYSAALGKQTYNYYDSNDVLKTDEDYGLKAKFVNAGYITGTQIIGGEIYSVGYSSEKGVHLKLKDNPEFKINGSSQVIYSGNSQTTYKGNSKTIYSGSSTSVYESGTTLEIKDGANFILTNNSQNNSTMKIKSDNDSIEFDPMSMYFYSNGSKVAHVEPVKSGSYENINIGTNSSTGAIVFDVNGTEIIRLGQNAISIYGNYMSVDFKNNNSFLQITLNGSVLGTYTANEIYKAITGGIAYYNSINN